VFARSAANQREVGFQDDAGVRMRRLRGRFGADELLAKVVECGYLHHALKIHHPQAKQFLLAWMELRTNVSWHLR
jgi:hypothetical protein